MELYSIFKGDKDTLSVRVAAVLTAIFMLTACGSGDSQTAADTPPEKTTIKCL